MNRSSLAEHGKGGSRRSVVLVTGMSGTGKSSVLAEMECRGRCVIDTDDPGWVVKTPAAGEPEPVWDLEQITALIDGHHTGWLFIAGCVANQDMVYDRFDAVVLLGAPVDHEGLEHRLAVGDDERLAVRGRRRRDQAAARRQTLAAAASAAGVLLRSLGRRAPMPAPT